MLKVKYVFALKCTCSRVTELDLKNLSFVKRKKGEKKKSNQMYTVLFLRPKL